MKKLYKLLDTYGRRTGIWWSEVTLFPNEYCKIDFGTHVSYFDSIKDIKKAFSKKPKQ